MERIWVQIDLNQPDAYVDSVLENAKRAKAQAASDISANIRKMLNNPEYSDVIFLCKDGIRVHGCRLFLVAQSIVLHRMFRNGMAESQLSEITLQEISSTALLPVLEFLYTGTLQEHAPKGWKIAYEIIGAAKFFLLEGLELMVFEYLLREVTKVGEDMEAGAKFLSITVEFVGILGKTIELIARDLVCILKSRSLQLVHLQALTSNAFMYLLQGSKIDIGKPKYLSREEFMRFKQIVLWCACKEFAPDKPLELHALPWEIIDTLELLASRSVKRKKSCERVETKRQVLASSIEKYLPLVNLQRISPWDLVHTIEPMDIIPSSVIMDALRVHALHRPPSTDGGTIGWSTSFKNHEIYKMSRDASVIKQTAPGIGFARYNWAVNFLDGYRDYKWEITIERVCDGFIEIGLHRDLGLILLFEDGQSLSGQPGGWALRMDAQGLSVNRRGTHQLYRGDSNFSSVGKDCSRLVYGKHYGHENSKVIVSLNPNLGTCFFTFDDEEPVLAWSKLKFPEGCFFPAVSLGSGSSGAVRIKVLCNAVYDEEDEEEDEDDEDDEEEEDEEDQNDGHN